MKYKNVPLPEFGEGPLTITLSGKAKDSDEKNVLEFKEDVIFFAACSREDFKKTSGVRVVLAGDTALSPFLVRALARTIILSGELPVLLEEVIRHAPKCFTEAFAETKKKVTKPSKGGTHDDEPEGSD